MPGIVGFTLTERTKRKARQALRDMQQLVTHHDFYVKDDLFCDEHVCATRAYTNIIQKQPQPYQDAGTYVWLDGEIYNRDELISRIGFSAGCDPALLLSLFKQNPDFSFLKQIDGIYSAVIYDSLQQNVYLMTDRYGLRQLYWTVHQGSLAWGSEAKAMLALPGFEPKIDCQAVENFFDVGYLLDNRTFFQGVELLPSGTFLTWDIKRQTAHTQRYWWWDEIKPLVGAIDEDEIAEELGRLFINAVELRCHEGERLGLGLSGGLDSRALLAAMPDRGQPIHALTFGKVGCDDFRFARMATQVKGAVHHFVELDASNWLMPRLDGIWWTDGQFNLMHMHGLECFSLAEQSFDIGLNGFDGDALMGGSYFGHPRFNEIQQHSNRGRRFINLGVKLGEVFIQFRLPFFDNHLVELTMSVPENLRGNSYMYNKMLLKTFPEFYKSIPWSHTGVPISWPPLAREAYRFPGRAKRKVLREISRFGIQFSDLRFYDDYPIWIRQEPARSFFDQVLMNSDALYPDYISRKRVRRDWERHLNGEDHPDYMCRYLTFEIWLQQVYAGNYRPQGVC
jgi:asparagine synthase (glutamine-hydrolysing)